ncbi:MAG: hypothetical protein AB8B82_10375 [Roseovarius sp.]
MACVLALVLVMRLVAAPYVMASPAPGIMAICSGGEIVYISMKDGQPVEDNEEYAAEACPFFGIISVLDDTYPPSVAPRVVTAAQAATIAGLALTSQRSKHAYNSRAPPEQA